LTGGFIRIIGIDTLSIKGEFQVSLADGYNGAENKIIIGSFGINQ
jgi:hypothetical protein